MSNIDRLYKSLPKDKIDWELINSEILKPYVSKLENTNQDKRWHGEGNVLKHTIMVCEELIRLPEYITLSDSEKLIVFLSALFHDIGKIVCTKEVDGEITSLKHALTGSLMLREYFWKDLGLSGSKEYQEFREAICFIVKNHSHPVREYDNLDKKVIELSLNSKLTKYYNIKLLSIVCKADILGRICDYKDDNLINLELFIDKAKELNCYENEFEFKDSYTKYHYLNSDNIWPYQELYNASSCNAILICGLPGTGKDTYIKKHYPDIPVISLDDIREELDIDPADNQSIVANEAIKKAKEYLRNKKTFIWNATNLTNLIRDKQLRLFHDYNAYVKVIFLETDLKTNLARNNSRARYVPEQVILNMISILNMPEASEAEEVEWICV